MNTKKFDISSGELSPLRKELIMKFLENGGNLYEANSIDERAGGVLFWNVSASASMIIENIETSEKFATTVSGTDDKEKKSAIVGLLYGVALEEIEGDALQDCFKNILDELRQEYDDCEC